MTDGGVKDREKVIVEWSVHRMRQDPRKLTIFIVLLVPANAFLFWMYHELYFAFPYFVFLGNLILVGSFCDYIFQVRFRVTVKGAHCRNLISKKHISWDQVKSCYISEDGIKLSPLERRSWLGNFRGFVLLFNDNREEVIEHVKRLATNRVK